MVACGTQGKFKEKKQTKNHGLLLVVIYRIYSLEYSGFLTIIGLSDHGSLWPRKLAQNSNEGHNMSLGQKFLCSNFRSEIVKDLNHFFYRYREMIWQKFCV